MNTLSKGRLVALIETMARNCRGMAMLSIVAVAFSASACAQAQASSAQQQETAAASVVQRYPAGSIASVEEADKALADVERERTLANTHYMQEQADCYPKFFTTNCLDNAKERHRIVLSKLKAIEVEANAFKRKEKVIERDRSLAARRAQDEAEAKQAVKTEKPAAEEAQMPKKESGKNSAAKPVDRVARHRAKLERDQEQEAADAKKREENIKDYERKVQEAQERQREVAAKKAEKERKRVEKAGASAKP